MVDLSMGGSTLSFALILIFIEWRYFFSLDRKKESTFLPKFFVTATFALALFLTSRSGMGIFLMCLLLEFIFSTKKTRRELSLTIVLLLIPAIILVISYLESEVIKMGF